MTDGRTALCAPITSRQNGNGNGHHNRISDALSVVTAAWTCKKRDGKVVKFDAEKIRAAVEKCFKTVNTLLDESPGAKSTRAYLHIADVAQVTRGVVYALATQQDPVTGILEVDVETVQRYVIQQLWAAEKFEAAEHYQNYREEHRRRRLTKPVSAEVQATFDRMQQHFPTDLQIYQYMSKFSRWDDAKGRRETWEETVDDRVMPWFKKELRSVGAILTSEEWQEMRDGMYALEALPAMRVTQMAGPALDRCHVGAYNCAYAPVDDLFAFPEALYILMQGTGHGFSCEADYVAKLPRIQKQRGAKKEMIVVADSTIGWCEAYHRALKLWVDGYDCEFDVSKVRKKGTRLVTKGGRASGPEPFLELMTFARNLFLSRQGRYLEDTDAHRLMCFTGRIVQVGGVRRAAMMSLSDLDSHAMRTIKSGNWTADRTYWVDGKYLSMSNNSAVYDFEGPPPVELFMEEWLSLVKSKSGERGIFNRKAAELHRPTRRKGGQRWGCNPCAEIILRPMGFCNLSIGVSRPHDTVASLLRKVRIAAYFGMAQSLMTKFRYIRPQWAENCKEERLLGVDITGHADCPLLKYGAPGREELQQQLKAEVAKVATLLSARWGINRPAADTTIKPSGDSSIFLDCASGVTGRPAPHIIRWVREEKTSPIARFFVESGVPHADAPEAPDRLFVFGFPKAAPEGSMLQSEMTALQQFDNWLQWKRNYSEHSVSTTIDVEDHEWPALGAKVYENIDEITGCAFLPADHGGYRYAPNQPVTKEEYDKFCSTFPKLNWAKLPNYEETDQTESSMTFACVGGACDTGVGSAH